MNILKDLPAGTIWPHLLTAIEVQVIADIREYSAARISDVKRGAETPALAAMLVEVRRGNGPSSQHCGYRFVGSS